MEINNPGQSYPAPAPATQLVRYTSGNKAAILMAVVIIAITLAASEAARWPLFHQLGIGALPISILLGMALAAVPFIGRLNSRAGAQKVQKTAQKLLLQAGIVLFGFQLSLTDLQAVGWQALVADIITIAVILPLGITLGLKVFRLPLSLAVLLSVGSAVCGAAAILAAAPVLGRYLHDGENEEQQQQSVGLAVAAVALFGTFSVLLYPQVQALFGLHADVTGIYIGSTIHEVAQAVAATDALSTATQHNAVIVKLMRVMMLAPVLIMLALWLQERKSDQIAGAAKHRLSVPGFVVLFLLVVVVNTLLPLVMSLPLLHALQHITGIISATFLALAMAALGLGIHWQHLLKAGWKPVMLGSVLWLLLLIGGGWLFSLAQQAMLI